MKIYRLYAIKYDEECPLILELGYYSSKSKICEIFENFTSCSQMLYKIENKFTPSYANTFMLPRSLYCNMIFEGFVNIFKSEGLVMNLVFIDKDRDKAMDSDEHDKFAILCEEIEIDKDTKNAS